MYYNNFYNFFLDHLTWKLHEKNDFEVLVSKHLAKSKNNFIELLSKIITWKFQTWRTVPICKKF